MDVRVLDRLQGQEGTVATWQLRADGVSAAAVRHAVRDLREVHDGVWVSGHAPLTERQRWWCATLTAPGSVLSHASAGALYGIWRPRDAFETVTRPGSGGPRRLDGVLVRRSRRLNRDVLLRRGLPVTSGCRTTLDLVGMVRSDRAAGRLVRDALRLQVVTAAGLRMIVGRHRGRRGVARLRALADEYAPLGLDRTRSDAEGLALAILEAAGVPVPAVNTIRAGGEADLCWPAWRLIVELDGPSFHGFPTEDARKQRGWEAAGWVVRRLSTDDVYEHPHRLLAAATRPNVHLLRR